MKNNIMYFKKPLVKLFCKRFQKNLIDFSLLFVIIKKDVIIMKKE